MATEEGIAPKGSGVGASHEKGLKVLASAIAEPFRAEIRTTIQVLLPTASSAPHYPGVRRRSDVRGAQEKFADSPPKLLGLLGNEDQFAKKYAEWTGKAARADGMQYVAVPPCAGAAAC